MASRNKIIKSEQLRHILKPAMGGSKGTGGRGSALSGEDNTFSINGTVILKRCE